jgi:hypothetical protein
MYKRVNIGLLWQVYYNATIDSWEFRSVHTGQTIYLFDDRARDFYSLMKSVKETYSNRVRENVCIDAIISGYNSRTNGGVNIRWTV